VTKKLHVMIDLETLGVRAGAPILSIGATKFDPHGSGVSSSFEIAIGQASCAEFGLTADPSTVEFWLSEKQAEARAALFDLRSHHLTDLLSALEGFANWFEPDVDEEIVSAVWANAPSFDCVILRHAYEKTGQLMPWGYDIERCFRTIKNLPAVKDLDWSRVGPKHTALGDALTQTDFLQRALKKLKIKV
jgi:hypothetical protein